jgi:FHS family L-fucose permease-like MFS transporter
MLMGSTQSSKVRSSAALIQAGALLPFILVTSLFFLWGMPNNLNDVLIRQFMKSFEISRFQAGLVQSAFYMGYFLLAAPAALLMRRFGYKSGIVSGLILLGAGCILFWPAAMVGAYSYFLCALFVIASGLSFLETAANPFVAQLGDPENAARRLNFAQAFNPLGAITGALIGTRFIFSGIELTRGQVASMQAAHTYAAYLRAETLRVVTPYLVLGAAALLLAVVVGRVAFPPVAVESRMGTLGAPGKGGFRQLLNYPHFLLAIVAQFMYVGAQVGTWSYFIQYVQDAVHAPEKTAGYFLTGTLASFGVGRMVSSLLMRWISPATLMGVYGLANIALLAVGVAMPGWTGLWAIFLSSFFMSVMYPTIFALGVGGLGDNTKIGASLIVMSIIGGAVLTPAMGIVSQTTGSIAVAYVVPLAGYIFVALYAFWGCRVKPVRGREAAGEPECAVEELG